MSDQQLIDQDPIPNSMYGLVYRDDLSAYFFGSLKVGFCQPLFEKDFQADQFVERAGGNLKVVFLQSHEEMRNYVGRAKQGGHVFHRNSLVAINPSDPDVRYPIRYWKAEFLAKLSPEKK